VQDAAVVAWAERDPKPRAYQARGIAGPDPLSSAFWGFLFGVAFLLSLAGDAEPAGLTRIGLTDEFVHTRCAIGSGHAPRRCSCSYRRQSRTGPDRLSAPPS
jgi:uncharacterized membrane protein